MSVPIEQTQATLAIVGAGRVGRSLDAAARAGGYDVRIAGRHDSRAVCGGAGAVLLCVPDPEIRDACANVAAAVPAPGAIGHVSGAGTLELLAPARDAGIATFSVHPLQTFPDGGSPVEGTPCAVAGDGDQALALAREIGERLGMRPFEVAEERRAAYHAAAAMSSNLLIALEESAAELLGRCGVEEPRELLAPLVLRTAANWAERGGEALTGPIARGDREAVERHRSTIAELAPELLEAYDALSDRARAVADGAGRKAAR